MKIKTSELSGVTLDWAVAVAANRRITSASKAGVLCADIEQGSTCERVFAPSTSYADGARIIDVAGITVIRLDDDFGVDADGYTNDVRIPVWAATTGQHRIDRYEGTPMLWLDDLTHGGSLLEAGMRCFVACKLGHEVDVPEGVAA